MDKVLRRRFPACIKIGFEVSSVVMELPELADLIFDLLSTPYIDAGELVAQPNIRGNTGALPLRSERRSSIRIFSSQAFQTWRVASSVCGGSGPARP